MISSGFPTTNSQTKPQPNKDRLSDGTNLARAEANTSNVTLPMIFEINRGQADDDVKFIGRAAGFGILLKSNEAVLALNTSQESISASHRGDDCGNSRLHMRLEGAAQNAAMKGEEPQETRANYCLGRDQSKWIRGVETYSRVSYSNVYPGIDLTFYGTPQQLEYDFMVAAGVTLKT